MPNWARNCLQMAPTATRIAALWSANAAVSAQGTGNSPDNGPTTANCYSDLFHAASDCDRLASGITLVSLSPAAPTANACFSAAYHAASDCDRLASEVKVASTQP